MNEGRTFSDFNYEKPETGESRETLMKLDLDKLKKLRDDLQIKVDQYGSSRPVRYAKSGNTDVLGQQSAPAMDDNRRDLSYLNIIKSVIAEKESKNESKNLKYLKTFESFKDDCGCGNYNEDGECECGESDDDIYNEEEIKEGKFMRGAMKTGYTFFGAIKSLVSLITLNFKKLKSIWGDMPIVYKMIDVMSFFKDIQKTFEDMDDFEDYVLNTYPDDYEIEFSSIMKSPLDGDYMREVFINEYRKEFNRDISDDIEELKVKTQEAYDKKKKRGRLSPSDHKTVKEFNELLSDIESMVNYNLDDYTRTMTVSEIKSLDDREKGSSLSKGRMII